jgi:hypothetical protein
MSEKKLPAGLRRVVVESPFAPGPLGDETTHVEYARRALADSLSRGEAPLASHLLYPQVLADTDPRERAQGIAAGLAWARCADLTAVYIDYGVSPGMHSAIHAAQAAQQPIEVRVIGKNP